MFVDVTAKAKIDFVHKSGASPEKYMVETFGSGVAWIDYDNDGFQDLYFVNGAPGAANALYHNNKDGTFRDVTAQAGVDGSGAGKTAYKTGVAVGDYDNNGYLDLFVTSFGPDVLYKNNGDGTFADVTAKAGVAGGPAEWSTSTGFLDFDRDGDLDLYVTNYLDFRLNDNPYCGLRKDGYRMYCHPTMFDGMADRLFRNNGNGTFTDVSRQAGIANPAGKGLGVTFCDFDRDGDTDIYIANDMVRNFLYRNNGNGTFVDVAYAAGVGFDSNGKPQAGMGVDCADVDGNGFPDIFVTNFSEELNTLYSNLGEGLFEDITVKAGLGAGFIPLGFGTKMFDFDNDGDLDIHVTNGHVIDNVNSISPTFRTRRRTCCSRTWAAGSVMCPHKPDRRSRQSGSAAGSPSRISTTTGIWTSSFRARDGRRCCSRTRAPAAATGSRSGPRAARATASVWGRPFACRPRTDFRCGRSTTWPAISAPTTSDCMSASGRRRSFSKSTYSGQAARSRP